MFLNDFDFDKSYILEFDLLQDYILFRSQRFDEIFYHKKITYNWLFDELDEKKLKLFEQLRNSRSKCFIHLKRWIYNYLFVNQFFYGYNIYFCTFTLNNSSINLNQSYLRKQVYRWCRSNGFNYVINTDYGDLHNRLHFHGLILTDKFSADFTSWTYGFTTFELCCDINSDKDKLSNYLRKLSLHGIKTGQKCNTRMSFYVSLEY